MAKTTAIRAPTTDPVNHQIVLRQLKEASETASRLRGNARDSFAQVGELLDAGIVRFVDGKLVAPSPSSLPPTVVPSTRQIKTGGSIQGGGSLAADLSLELVGDAGSPGNSMLYGTNATGVKGWYTQPAAATTLASLADVSISSLTNGQVLAYNSTASKWENQAAGGGSLSSLTDVLLTSPSNGQALVYNSAAGKWENQSISSGGSGGSGGTPSNWTPDSHPAIADPTNDEFEASSLSSQWTWVNKGAAAAKLNQGYAYLIGDSAIPYSFIGQVTPGSSWKYRAKMMFEVGYASYAFGGISIWNASSGKNYIFGPSQAANGRAVYSFTSQAGAGYSQVGSDTGYGGPTAFVYYEIQCDGTSLYFRVSESGEDDSFHQVYTATLASFIGSVDHIGIAVNQYVTPVGMIVDWFRRVDTGVTPGTGVTSTASGGYYAAALTPDTRPQNPTAWDDEFEGSVIDTTGTRFAGANAWTWFNQGSTATATLLKGSMILSDSGAVGNTWRLLAQPVPSSGAWTFRARMGGTVSTNYQNSAMIVYNNGNGKFLTFGPAYNSGAAGAAVYVYEFPSFGGSGTNVSSNSGGLTNLSGMNYYQVAWDGSTNLTFSVSSTGLDGSFTQVYSQALTTYLGAMTHIGLGIGEDSSNSTLTCDWFRRTDGVYSPAEITSSAMGEPGDVPPSYPTAYDDEFTTPTLSSKWTVHTSDGAATLVKGTLKLKSGPSGALASVTQVPPTAPWTFQFKIAPGVSTGAPAIMVNNSSTNKMIPIVAVYDSGNTGVIWIRLTNNGYGAAPTYSSTIYNGAPTGWIAGWKGWVYYQLAFDGTTFTLSWSPTGLPDTWEQIATETASTWLGGAPTDIGLCCWNANVPIYMDWIRRTA